MTVSSSFPRTLFLNPHPATLVWWERRVQCRQCHWHRFGESKYKGEYCDAPGVELSGMTVYLPCVMVREEPSQCGPQARLFSPKKEPPEGGS